MGGADGPGELEVVGDHLGLGGVGGIGLLHADELDRHRLKARLVQNIRIDARLHLKKQRR